MIATAASGRGRRGRRPHLPRHLFGAETAGARSAAVPVRAVDDLSRAETVSMLDYYLEQRGCGGRRRHRARPAGACFPQQRQPRQLAEICSMSIERGTSPHHVLSGEHYTSISHALRRAGIKWNDAATRQSC